MGSDRSRFDPQKHHRRSISLPGYDYSSSGAYYVTIVTYHRDILFGEVITAEMILNDLGNIADECWRAIPEHFPNVELGAYVVMPNHVHGIIVITDIELRADADASARSRARYIVLLRIKPKNLAKQLRVRYQRSFEHTKPP